MHRPVLFAACLLFASASFGAPGLRGEWKIMVSWRAAAGQPRQEATLICAFETSGERLSGTCRPESGPEGASVSGVVRSGRMDWQFAIALAPDLPKQPAVFRATLNSSRTRARGTVSIGDRRGTFIGMPW